MTSDTAMDNMFGQNPLNEYLTDAMQRTTLYWDTMRQRGNQYLEHMEETIPHVLNFDYEIVLNGLELSEPVNYGLVQIIPPKGTVIDELKRPFVVIDPRAGHGPGIGGFKATSEIGVALRAGHPCYFIGFLPMPKPKQTIDRVLRAKEIFLRRIIKRHPDAEGMPVIIGNCQAGWAVMMLAAKRPDLCGPIIVAGSPLSYWAGARGANPMRYSGGLLGGSWLTSLTSDLGNGIFDGAWLVQNFENLNPANTYWSKQYNLYSKIDTEAKRYLGFERWWGGHVFLNGEEIQYIVDKLFVGNKLSTARIVTDDGLQVDFRNIRSPIICFCSKGDNITPPPQALGWICDLYDSVDEIQASGQTIVYAVHENIGHLGIFVSGSVAQKEHQEFAHHIDLIDCLPPGLYEAVIEEANPDDVNTHLINDDHDHISRFETRTLDDIRALGCNSEKDKKCFKGVSKLSKVTLGLYRTTLQPFIKSMATEENAKTMRRMHPLRFGYEMFSDKNPFMKHLEPLADEVRKSRRPAKHDNIFWQWQSIVSDGIAKNLDLYREWCEIMSEKTFFGIYQNPLLQALVGLEVHNGIPRRKPGDNPKQRTLVKRKKMDLLRSMEQGGPKEAVVRSVLFVSLPESVSDERTFERLNRIRKAYASDSTLREMKRTIREQYFMLLLDENRALETIPALIKGHEELGPDMLELIRKTVTAQGPLPEPLEKRMALVERYFKGKEEEL